MAASYPATCSLGHAGVVLKDDSDLQTHITSEHPNGDAAAIRKALVSPEAGGASGIPEVVLGSALKRLGIKVEDLHSVSASELSAATDLTPESFISFFTAFGKKQTPSIDPSIPFFPA